MLRMRVTGLLFFQKVKVISNGRLNAFVKRNLSLYDKHYLLSFYQLGKRLGDQTDGPAAVSAGARKKNIPALK